MLLRETALETIERIEPNLFRLTVNTGVELTRHILLDQYAFMDRYNEGESFGVLDDRIHEYSYSADGLRSIGDHANLRAVAIWVADVKHWNVAEIHETYPRQTRTPLRLFLCRDEAIRWLRECLAQVDDCPAH